MTRNLLAAASAALVAAMLVVSIGVGIQLPGELRLPTHWNLAGEPDSFAPKWVALLLSPAMTAAVSALFHFLPSIEPLERGLERSRGLYLTGWAAILLVGAVIEFTVVASGLGWRVPFNQLIVATLGLVLLVIGNQLGKSRRMFLIGLRTPWTLASEEVWIRTHRVAGKLMVLGGLAMIAAALLPLPSGLLGSTVLAVLIVAAGVPIVYSFLLWRREKEAQSRGYSSTAE